MNYSWFVRWVIPLVAVSFFLTVCSYAIPWLELKNFWYHYSGACAIAVGFYWQWVAYVEGPNLGVPFIDHWLRRSRIGGHNVDVFQYVKNDTLVVYHSKGKNLWGLISCLGIGLALLYVLGYKNKSYFWGFFMAYFSLTGALRFGRDLFDSSPQLVLREDGLATRKLGFVTWANVRIIQLRDSSSGDSSSTNLDIYVHEKNSPDDTLRADLLSVAEQELRTSISHFAKREVPFV